MKVYRHKNLVYIAIEKHASTSYKVLFEKTLKWDIISLHHINLNQDHVFAHMLDPKTRYIKGTAQAIINYDLEDLIGHPKFDVMLSHMLFDVHSQPVVPRFGRDFCWKIDWIPLNDVVSSEILTAKFLEHHGIMIDPSRIPRLHRADDRARRLQKYVQEKTQHGPLSMHNWYNLDVLLCTQIEKYFRSQARTWPEISWLKHRKD